MTTKTCAHQKPQGKYPFILSANDVTTTAIAAPFILSVNNVTTTAIAAPAYPQRLGLHLH